MEEEIKTNGEPALIKLENSYVYKRDGNKKCAAVIGAGPAGLAALRRLTQANIEVTCFEQTRHVGGIWNYAESFSPEQKDMPTHSFIYKNLRTNLPKETMMFPEFPYQDLPESYIHADEVVKYLRNFTNHYNLEEHIKYRHKVVHVKPLGSCWSLTALDLSTQEEQVYRFDSIFVCSGPFSTPVYPDIELAKFGGHQSHSKEFRTPEMYKDKTVLVIGLGPSGLDITYHISNYAKQIYLSSNKGNVQIDVPKNVTFKPRVKNVEDRIVYFDDDSSQEIDSIIHCTGYTFHYPFLDKECEVTVNKFVFPLYKHFISIRRPTLYFIGLPRPINHLFMCDFQVRVAVRYLKGEIQFPSEKEMMLEWEEDIKSRELKGQFKHKFHQLGRGVEQYFNELSELGQFEKIPPVQISMFHEAHTKSIRDFANFRKYVYRIINDKEYEINKIE